MWLQRPIFGQKTSGKVGRKKNEAGEKKKPRRTGAKGTVRLIGARLLCLKRSSLGEYCMCLAQDRA